MRFNLTIFFLILTTSIVFGQNDTVFIKYNQNKFEDVPSYKTDTIVFNTPSERQILYGTTVLPWTQNQQIAKGYGLFLENVFITPCKQDYSKLDEMTNQITAIKTEKDSLTIEIKYWGNCCHSFLCDVEIVEDTTINLIIYGYGATYCSCDCCYGLTYNFSTMKFEGFDKLKFVTINGNPKTKKKFN